MFQQKAEEERWALSFWSFSLKTAKQDNPRYTRQTRLCFVFIVLFLFWALPCWFITSKVFKVSFSFLFILRSRRGYFVLSSFSLFSFDSEIRWRVKEALAGRLTYDGGGKIDCALRANFDVINLVPAGPFYPKSSASNTNGVGAKSTKTSASSSSTSLTLTRRRRHSSSTSDKHFGNATAPPPSVSYVLMTHFLFISLLKFSK